MNEVQLGQILEGQHQRDAVHVAIKPVLAGKTLWPAQHIGLVKGSTDRVDDLGEHIGIVDPFLGGPVRPEQRFYMLLYPNTITSLRHNWKHPAFNDVDETSDSSISEIAVAVETALRLSSDKAESQLWMEKFAAGHNYYPNYYTEGERSKPYNASELIEYAKDFLITGERHVQQGEDSLRDGMYEELKGEFWKHFEIITGIKPEFEDGGDNPFCCTC